MCELKGDLAYELLRQARNLLKSVDPERSSVLLYESAQTWLKDYESLPGDELSIHEVRVLRNPSRRCGHNEEVVDKLLDSGYLMQVKVMRSRRVVTQIRLSLKGREALRLRNEFDSEVE